MADQKEKAREIKQRYEQKWMAIKEVIGIGIGMADDQSIGIIISVTEKPDKIRKEIPARIDGVTIQIQETGEFKAQ